MSARHSLTEEYATVGAIPGCVYERLKGGERIIDALAQCVLIYDSHRDRDADSGSAVAAAMLLKVLQRGRAPLPTLGVEREALRHHGLLAHAEDLEAEIGAETGWRLPSKLLGRGTVDAVLDYATRRGEFVLDSEFAFDDVPSGVEGRGADVEGVGSTAEALFLETWVPRHLGSAAAHWFTPQAPLGDLLTSRGAPSKSDARRVDFLFCHPRCAPFVVEIDGGQHVDAVAIDRDRDDALARVGIEVIRVASHEVERGRGTSLNRILRLCQSALSPSTCPDDRVAATVVNCATAAKFQFALARAVGFGWLTGGRPWHIDLSGGGPVAAAAICDVVRLLSAFDAIFGSRSAPTRCCVSTIDGDVATYCLDPAGEWVAVANATVPTEEPQRLGLGYEAASPFHQLPADAPDILIRPASLPIALATTQSARAGWGGERHAAKSSTLGETEKAALRVFLRHLFRKADYRPMQAEALFRVLRGLDLVVLLPTGLGKSLIYQMAGLLTPGTTLVIDPLVALMEDQIEGLQRCGLDRAAYIASDSPPKAQVDALLRNVEKGQMHFLFIAPERLQVPRFRDTLGSLAMNTPINLAVIDEAHCVSEWGHDFRPAYLSLGNNLRALCAGPSKGAPPLLALTGTASRTVLRDMLIDLDIDRDRSDALIRPDTFNRRELEFEIVEERDSVADPAPKLRGLLDSLPADFGMPRARFFRSARDNTMSGIAFVPYVNGAFGLHNIAGIVGESTNREVTIYSGSAPKGGDGDWGVRKRENARKFKANEVSTLVSTKAFGMGIDKPNVRYTIHVGLPTSIEQWYQEAGRAGRDGKPAKCKVIFFEYDQSRTDQLLSQEVDFEAARVRYRRITAWRTKDDVTRALWFHFRAFQGKEDDMEQVGRLLPQIGDLAAKRTLEVPFDGPAGPREVAIYRLRRLEIIDDYQVDFGARKFVIDAPAFDFGRSRQALLDYVAAIQPARASALQSELDEVDGGDTLESAMELVRILVGLTYDLIERSRRSMLRAVVELARQASSGEQVRRRLLDYLEEGIGAETMDGLLQDERVDFDGWWQMVANVRSPIEAGELRGLCVRRLEGYPDHPALLLTRAVAEVLCSDCDQGVVVEGVRTALMVGLDRYGMTETQFVGVVNRMFDLARDGLPHYAAAVELGFPLALAMYHLAEAGRLEVPVVGLVRDRARETGDPWVVSVLHAWRLRDVVGSLAGVVERSVAGLESLMGSQRVNGGRDVSS